MCGLCSGDKREQELAKRAQLDAACRLEDIAKFYRKLAHGEVMPHGDAAKSFVPKVHAAIHEMVVDWL